MKKWKLVFELNYSESKLKLLHNLELNYSELKLNLLHNLASTNPLKPNDKCSSL